MAQQDLDADKTCEKKETVSSTSRSTCSTSSCQTLDDTINYSELKKKTKTDNVCAPSGFVQAKIDSKKKKRKSLKKKAKADLKLDWSDDDDFVKN